MSRHDPSAARLRELVAELSDIKGNGEECPSAELLWDSACEQLDPVQNQAVIRHLGECPACGLNWELARDLASAGARPTAIPRTRRWWPALAAAAALGSAAIGLWIVSSGGGAVHPAVVRSFAQNWLVSELPGQTLDRDACVLSWARGPGGTTYDLVVTSESVETVTRIGGLENPIFELDRASLARIAPGGKIYWRVTAHLPGGRRVASLTFINTVD